MTKFLGKLPKKVDPKVPHFRTLLNPDYNLKPPVSTNNRAKVIDWSMLGNDKCGCCVAAAMEHGNQAMSANANVEIVPDESSCLTNYSNIGVFSTGQGYNPATGENDNGLCVSDAVNYWMKCGLQYNTQKNGKIIGQASISVVDEILVKYAIDNFCGLMCGLELPTTAEAEYNQGLPWQLTLAQAGGWGGHGVWLIDYDSNWLYCVTWGSIQKMSWEWYSVYCDELIVVLDPQWISFKTQTTPLNVTLPVLSGEIQNLHGTVATGA